MNADDTFQIDESYMVASRRKEFFKKHRLEVLSCDAILEQTVQELNAGLSIMDACSSVRPEGHGLWRIGPSGSSRGRAEIRLYFYFYLEGKRLYPLTWGDKKTQQKDIAECHQRIKKLFKKGD